MCVTPQCDLIPAAQNLYLGLNFLVAEFGECEEGMLGSGDGTRRDACTANGDGEDELLGSRDGDDVALRGHMLVGEGCAEGPSLFALSWRGGAGQRPKRYGCVAHCVEDASPTRRSLPSFLATRANACFD